MEPRVLTFEARGEGDPIVLVPGGLTGWLSWIPHAERLSERWRTIRVQPIHNELGSAGQPGDPSYTAAIEREALVMTLDELGLDRPHVAGWSGGGRAGLELAMAHPGRVRSLTLIEPAVHWVLERLGREMPDGAQEEADFIREQAGEDWGEEHLAAFLEMAGFVSSRDDAPDHPMWERWLEHRNAMSWQFAALDDPGRGIEELGELDLPALLVKGSDSTEELRGLVDILAERLPAATVLELPGDHACHLQSIDAFLEAFEAHLRSA